MKAKALQQKTIIEGSSFRLELTVICGRFMS